MNTKEISIVELFSGIGSQATALFSVAKKMGYKMVSQNTCEWDIHSIVAYDFIHNGVKLDPSTSLLSKSELLQELEQYKLSNDGKTSIGKSTLSSLNEDLLRTILSSIKKTRNLVNVQDVSIHDLPDDIDIMTYSFPCQDLSNVGAFHGYNKGIDKNSGSRSSLLWQVGKILEDRKEAGISLPKFLLLENVTTLEAKRHSKNFREWQSILENLGYINKVYKLNAVDFGVPQNRNRLLMISVLSSNSQVVNSYFETHDLNDHGYIESLKIPSSKLSKFLRLDMENSCLFNEALMSQPLDTKSRRTIWSQNSKIIDETGKIKNIVQTITTKQDRHPNSGNIYFDYDGNTKSKYRFLTPRECFLLMGFHERDFDVLVNNNRITKGGSLFFSRDRLYKMAGNSIVVNILKQVFTQIIELNELLASPFEVSHILANSPSTSTNSYDIYDKR